MCRGGKDGVIRRCVENPVKKVNTKYRKMLKYRAFKAGVSVSEWAESNPEIYAEILGHKKAEIVTALEIESQHLNETAFKGRGETRLLLRPDNLEEHAQIATAEMQHMDLTAEEQDAIWNYTSYMHEDTNKILRGKESVEFTPEDEEDEYQARHFRSGEHINDYVASIDRVLSHRNPEKRVLYRGVGVHGINSILDEKRAYPKDRSDEEMVDDLVQHYAPGKSFAFDTYSSTSHDAGFASEFTSSGSVQLVYEMKTNAGVDVTHLSDEPDEREVIVPRGMRFKVENVYADDSYTGDSTVNSGTVVVVQLTEVDAHDEEMDTMDPFLPEKYDSASYLEEFPPEEMDDDEDDYY